MKLKRISRVVRRAQRHHLRVDTQRPGRHRAQLFLAGLPNRPRRLRRKQLVDTKISFEFQRTPVIHRIAQAFGHRRRKSLEFLPITGASGDAILRNAVGPHHAPFIMIPRQPELREIGPLLVFRQFARRQVVVEIEKRLRGGPPVVKLDRGRGIEQEIVMDESAAHGAHWVEHPRARCIWQSRADLRRVIWPAPCPAVHSAAAPCPAGPRAILQRAASCRVAGGRPDWPVPAAPCARPLGF